MADFHFFHLIEVRYGDLDPQGHVNNAKFLTYMEQARVFYLKQLKLWEGGSFLNLGIILADVQITFKKALQFGDPVRVGVRISRIGNKSMTSEYRLEDGRDASVFATGSSVLVAYDYQNKRSVSIPEEWRKAKFYEGPGCIECAGTGYHGRTAIHELLDLSDRVRELILEKRPSSEIRKAAHEEGMSFLRDSALARVKAGITTMKEINKVTFIETTR